MSLPQQGCPVGRLAPSPTGFLHLGHARTFLLAWWDIRQRNGRMLLRIEDLDGPRVRPGMIDATLKDLEWLGLDWDAEPLIQSTGAPRFRAAMDALLASGRAYPCVCSRGDVRAAQSAPQLGDTELRYPGTCRGRFPSVEHAERVTGREAALRFVTGDAPVVIEDAFAGTSVHDVGAAVGDFVVARKNGAPAYQLAVVIDDAFQGVTDVLRGDDLLPSAARQQALQSVLGLRHPRWLHVPLVTDEAGRRLAKRADDLSLAMLRAGGTDPRAIVAWAARSAGLEVPPRVSPRECVAAFSLADVPRSALRLTRETVAALTSAR